MNFFRTKKRDEDFLAVEEGGEFFGRNKGEGTFLQG